MQREYEFVDLIVAIGLFATIVAGGLLFLAANGRLSLSPSRLSESGDPISVSNGVRWLQPVLGQAIVDQDLLERRYKKTVAAAAVRLTAIVEDQRQWQNSPFGYLDSIKLFEARGEADYHARVQAVMGRAIVNSTGRGIRSGAVLAEQQSSELNAQLIDGTEAMGRQMDIQFVAHWQPNLGRAIVLASQDDAKASALRQARLGQAIMQLAAIQTAYDGTHARLQEQLGSAAMVAAQTELQREGSDLAEARMEASVVEVEQEPWPDIPSVAIVAGSLMLVSLFMAGLFIPSELPDVRVAI